MARRSFWIVLITAFTLSLGAGAMVPVLPKYAQLLGASGLWIGLTYAGLHLTRIFLGPVVGRWFDLKGQGVRYLRVSQLFYLSSSLIAYHARHYLHLFLGRMVQGLGSSSFNPVASSLVAKLAPPGRFSTYLGAYSTAFFLGMGLGPVLGGALADHTGIRPVFLILGGVALLNALLLFLGCQEEAPGGHRKRAQVVPYREVIRNRLILSVMLYRFAFAMARTTLFAFFPLLGAARGLSHTEIGAVMTLQMSLMAFLQFPGGWVVDRLPRKFPVLYGTLGATAIGLLILPRVSTLPEFFAVGVLFGLAGALSNPTSLGIAAEEGERNGAVGTVLSLNQSAFGLGMTLGPTLAGVVYDHLGLEAVFYTAVGYVLLGWLGIWVFRRVRPHVPRLGGVPLP